MYLKDRANQQGQCWPAIKTIARELQLSVSTTSNPYTAKQAQFSV